RSYCWPEGINSLYVSCRWYAGLGWYISRCGRAAIGAGAALRIIGSANCRQGRAVTAATTAYTAVMGAAAASRFCLMNSQGGKEDKEKSKEQWFFHVATL